MEKNTFNNSVVIVTGASHGIGRALALQLADQGARLALAARSSDRLEALAEEIRGRGGQALAVPTDVADPSACRALVEGTLQAFGQIDMLVNDAGQTMWARFDQVQDLGIFEQVMRVNYLGSLYCTYYALPELKRSRGRIVGVCSLAGKTGIPERSGYAASKHAMTGFFDTLRIELEGSGVSVTMIYPAFVATGSQERGFGADGKPLGSNPLQSDKVMTADRCAAIILRAAARRQREEILSLRGKLGLWLKLAAPAWVDRMAQRAIREGR